MSQHPLPTRGHCRVCHRACDVLAGLIAPHPTPQAWGLEPGVHTVACCRGTGQRPARTGTAQQQLDALAQSFPTLAAALARVRTASRRSLPSVAVQHAEVERTSEALAELLATGKLGSGAEHAARFCLAVYNGATQDHEHLRFDLVRAMACWDDQHRAAFAAWAQDPVIL